MQPNEGRYSEQNQRSPFAPLNINFNYSNSIFSKEKFFFFNNYISKSKAIPYIFHFFLLTIAVMLILSYS